MDLNGEEARSRIEARDEQSRVDYCRMTIYKTLETEMDGWRNVKVN
jgi:hypothetical protein